MPMRTPMHMPIARGRSSALMGGACLLGDHHRRRAEGWPAALAAGAADVVAPLAERVERAHGAPLDRELVELPAEALGQRRQRRAHALARLLGSVDDAHATREGRAMAQLADGTSQLLDAARRGVRVRRPRPPALHGTRDAVVVVRVVQVQRGALVRADDAALDVEDAVSHAAKPAEPRELTLGERPRQRIGPPATAMRAALANAAAIIRAALALKSRRRAGRV